jgi:hypothetical protein
MFLVPRGIGLNSKIQRQQYETNPNSFFTISDHIENLTPQFSKKDGENQEADRFNWDCIRDKSRASFPFIRITRVIRAIQLTVDSEGLFELTRTPWPVCVEEILMDAACAF